MKMHQCKLFLACVAAAAAAASCSESTTNPDPAPCAEGEYACALNVLTKCEDGIFATVETCAADQTCNAETKKCETNEAPACMNAAKRCNDSRSAVEVCQNGAWRTDTPCLIGTMCDAKQVACVAPQPDPTPDAGDCENAQVKCENNALYECQSNVWVAVQTCAADQTCNAGAKSCDAKTSPDPDPAPECSAGDGYRCDGLMIYECRQGTWTHINTCISGKEACNAQTGQCDADTVKCVEGHKKCNDAGTAVVECKNGVYVQDGADCDAGKACLGGQCIATAPCADGTKDSCDGNVAVKCINGAQVRKDCSGDGSNYECALRNESAVCEPHVCDDNARQCKDSGTSQECNDNAWIDEACGANEICSGGSCVERTCAEDAKRCANNAAEVCKNNAWTVSAQCTAKQMCQNGACVAAVCSDGDKRCSANALEVCANNAYSQNKTCNDDERCIESGNSAECQKKVCDDGAYQCTSDNKLMLCKSNAWTQSKDCDAMYCNADTKKCENKNCDQDAEKCSNSLKSVMICQNNAWTTKAECSKMTPENKCEIANGVAQCVEKETAECADGVSCSGNNLVVCSGGHIATTTDCAAQTAPGECVSSSSGASCVPYECTGSGYVCDDNVLKQCNAATHKYEIKKTCNAATQACNAASKTCDDYECVGDVFKCDGSVLKKCIDHEYQTVETCAAAQTCDASTKSCVANECQTGDYSCDGKKLRDCVSNAWHESKTCTASQECDAAAKKCVDHECEGTSMQCSGKVLKQCQNYKLAVKATCSDTQECDADAGECVDHECEYKTQTSYCVGETAKTCKDYRITSSQTCTASQICDASKGQCIARNCSEGAYSCSSDNKLLKCSSNAWTAEQTCSETQKCDAGKKQCVLAPVCTPGAMRCQSNVAQKCGADGQWATDAACTVNQVCVASSATAAQCADKWENPGWCQFKYLDSGKTGRGYGRILIPASVDKSKIVAQLACGSASQPVQTWKNAADGIVNPNCSDCYVNTEYMTPSMNLAAGTYACAFRFVWGPETFYCAVDDKETGSYMTADDSTVLSNEFTRELSVAGVADDAAIAWCKGATVAKGSNAYAQALVGKDKYAAAQAGVTLICGKKSAKPSTWSESYAMRENILYTNNSDNYEYMTDPVAPTDGYVCATIIKFGAKSYACPLSGGTPAEYKADTTLDDAYLSTPAE